MIWVVPSFYLEEGLSKTVALIDLDTPIFRAAVSCEEKTIKVTNPSGKTRTFENRTELKEYLESQDKLDQYEHYQIEDIQTQVNSLKTAQERLERAVQEIIDTVFPDEVIYMISGKLNFRNDLPLPTRYKSNRISAKPLLLKSLQTWARKRYNALIPDNCECDDLQIILGYEVLERGDTPVVVACDKDSKAYSGLFLFDPDHPERGVDKIPDLGEIKVDSKGKVRAIGMLQYGLQMLIGDGIDGLKPTKLAGVKFGDKSALKVLKDCKTEQEVLDVVIQHYKKWYPAEFEYTAWNGDIIKSNWKHMLDLYHKGLRMKAAHDDKLDAVEFYKSKGVEL